MDTQTIVIIAAVAVVVVVIVAIVAWMMSRKRHSDRLRSDFGQEYDREVDRLGRGKAERELEGRAKRVEQLQITPLSSREAARYQSEWDSVQARFVDNPEGAVGQADDLVGQVMQARGYPVGDFEQRVADVSVDHPDVVSNYRAAHTIAANNDRGKASTEDLRQAMVHYRALFQDLLEVDSSRESERSREGRPRRA